MFKLDNDFLTSLGLGSLPVDEKNKLLQHIYERLEMNVGMRLAEKMTDQQLDEFESFIDRNDEAGALRWLETNFPNYKQVVADELEKLKVEVQQAAPQILAAAQNTPVAPQAPAPQQQFAPPAPDPYQQAAPVPQAPAPQPWPPADQPSPQVPVQPSPSFGPDPTLQPAPFQPTVPAEPSAQPWPPVDNPQPQAPPQQFTPPPPGFAPEQYPIQPEQ